MDNGEEILKRLDKLIANTDILVNHITKPKSKFWLIIGD
jgi:hypothetical protein